VGCQLEVEGFDGGEAAGGCERFEVRGVGSWRGRREDSSCLQTEDELEDSRVFLDEDAVVNREGIGL